MPDIPAVHHVRRYLPWYGGVAVWILLIVLLPVVGVDVLAAVALGPAPDASTSTIAGQPSNGPGAPFAVGGALATHGSAPVGTSVTPTASPLPDSPPADPDPLDAALDPVFGAVPPIGLPPLPDELVPVVAALGPLANLGCGNLGLVGTLLTVAPSIVSGVPIQRLLPYLAPITSACATFPLPAQHSECDADESFTSGGNPPIFGLALDILAGMESAGGTPPTLSESLREQLHCEVVST
jgi:hypothetical protein